MKLKMIVAALTVMLFGAGEAVKAQEYVCPVDVRTFMVGTTLGFSTSSASYSNQFVANRTNTGTMLTVGPRMGYFFFNNFVAGMGIDFSMVNQRDETNNRTSNYSQFVAGPYFRMYFPVTNLAFFTELNTGFGGSTVTISTASGTEEQVNTVILGLGAGPGISIFSAGNFALESSLKYNLTHTSANTNSLGKLTTTINALDIVFGMHYYIGASPHASTTTDF